MWPIRQQSAPCDTSIEISLLTYLKEFDKMSSRFDTILARDGRMDGQTDML